MNSDFTVCIAGKNQIAVDGLRAALSAYGAERVVVCPNAGDDGVSRWQPSLLRYAREWGVRVARLDELYEVEALTFLSLEFDQIIVPDRFKSKSLFNTHFSRLPAYKGMYTAAWPILNGETLSGVTLHRIDAGIDTGDIVDCIDIPLTAHTTARDLYFDCMRSAAQLVERHLAAVVDGSVTAQPQVAVGSSYYAKSSINYSTLAIDLRNTADTITRQSRAFSFREFQTPKIDGVNVQPGAVMAERSVGKAGKVRADGNALVVSSIDFDVRFERDNSWIFFDYVAQGDVEAVPSGDAIVDQINFTNAQGWTPLMIAAYQGKSMICQSLLRAGADLGLGNRNGTTALMYAKDYAVQSGDFSICRLLLDAGADLNQADCFERSVVDYALLRQQHTAIKFFGEKTHAV